MYLTRDSMGLTEQFAILTAQMPFPSNTILYGNAVYEVHTHYQDAVVSNRCADADHICFLCRETLHVWFLANPDLQTVCKICLSLPFVAWKRMTQKPKDQQISSKTPCFSRITYCISRTRERTFRAQPIEKCCMKCTWDEKVLPDKLSTNEPIRSTFSPFQPDPLAPPTSFGGRRKHYERTFWARCHEIDDSRRSDHRETMLRIDSRQTRILRQPHRGLLSDKDFLDVSKTSMRHHT